MPQKAQPYPISQYEKVLEQVLSEAENSKDLWVGGVIPNRRMILASFSTCAQDNESDLCGITLEGETLRLYIQDNKKPDIYYKSPREIASIYHEYDSNGVNDIPPESIKRIFLSKLREHLVEHQMRIQKGRIVQETNKKIKGLERRLQRVN